MTTPTLTLGEFALRLHSREETLLTVVNREYDGFLSAARTPHQLTISYANYLYPDDDQFNLRASFYKDYFYLHSTGLVCLYRFGAERGILHIAHSKYSVEANLQNALRYLCQLLAMQHQSLFFHAAGIYHVGLQKAFLFIGESGSGKTTISRLSNGPEYQLISDDLVLVGVTPNGVKLYPAPFFGELKGQNNPQQEFPLGGIFLLQKGKNNMITSFSSISEQVATLAANIPYVESYNRARYEQVLALVTQLAFQQTVSRLTFIKQSSFWEEIIHYYNQKGRD